MRQKDDNKSEAILKATLELLNEIGLSDISMSQIAKRSKVSQATIYVYFASKEEMLGKLYVRVKEKMSRQLLYDLNGTLRMQELCERFMRNSMRYMLDNKEEFLFMEQFLNSPLVDKLCLEDTSKMFTPLYQFVEKGKQRGEIKQLDTMLLLTYLYFPVTNLVKAHFKGQSEANEKNLKQIIQLSWDAIKA